MACACAVLVGRGVAYEKRGGPAGRPASPVDEYSFSTNLLGGESRRLVQLTWLIYIVRCGQLSSIRVEFITANNDRMFTYIDGSLLYTTDDDGCKDMVGGLLKLLT